MGFNSGFKGLRIKFIELAYVTIAFREFSGENEFHNKRYMLPFPINTSENILTVQNRKT